MESVSRGLPRETLLETDELLASVNEEVGNSTSAGRPLSLSDSNSKSDSDLSS